MGIIKSYLRISKEQIENLKSAKDENSVKEILKSSKEFFDIDKSWQILNYLITGEKDFSEHPFTKVIYPDNYTIEISEEEEKIMEEYYESGMQNETEQIQQIEAKQELSQGFVNTNEIKEIISKLESIKIENTVEKANFDTFNEIGIYPEIWSNSKENKDYIKEHFKSLYAFLQRANKENDFIIVN